MKDQPHRRVCPLHGPYRTTWSFTGCPAAMRATAFLNVPGYAVGCPGETWRADDPPSLPARLWRRLRAWSMEDGTA